MSKFATSTPPPVVREAIATINARQAVKTAGERLEAIETWARRTFYAAIVGAACSVPIGVCATFAIYQYVRLIVALSLTPEPSWATKVVPQSTPPPASTRPNRLF